MAKAIATCTCKICGQQFEMVAFKQNRALADSYEKWAVENCTVCRECYRAQQVEKAKEETADLQPITEGSPKQIIWATQIRADAVKYVAKTVVFDRVREKTEGKFDEFINKFMNNISARWWIDHRYDVNSVRFYAEEFKAFMQ